MSDRGSHDGKFWLGFFIGGLLGAVVLFFLGTKEGKKTKKQLTEQGSNLLDELEKKLGELEEKGKDLVKQGEDIKERVIEKLADTKEDISQETTEKLDTTLAQLEALQEKGRATTATLRKRIFKNLPKRS